MKFHKPNRVWTIKHFVSHQYFITDIECNNIFRKVGRGYYCIDSYRTKNNFRSSRYTVLDDILKLGIK